MFASETVSGEELVVNSSATTAERGAIKQTRDARKAYTPKICQDDLLKFPGSPLPTHNFFLLISDRVLSLNTGEREVKGTANFLAANSLVNPGQEFVQRGELRSNLHCHAARLAYNGEN